MGGDLSYLGGEGGGGWQKLPFIVIESHSRCRYATRFLLNSTCGFHRERNRLTALFILPYCQDLSFYLLIVVILIKKD